MDYFNALNYFFQFAQFRNLPTSTRIAYLAILHRWNSYRRPASFALSDRELSNLTGLGIGRAITAAKRQLKNLGLIDFKANTHGTTYFLDGTHHKAASGTPPTTKTPHEGAISNTEPIKNLKEEKEKGAQGENVILTF